MAEGGGGGGDEVSYGDSNLRGRSAERHNFFVIVKRFWESFKKLIRIYEVEQKLCINCTFTVNC